MSEHRLRTTVLWEDAAGNEHEADVTVHYSVKPGYAGDRIDPPCNASVEITAITGMSRFVPGSFYDDEYLKLECMNDWHEDRIAAEKYRAEQRRDAMLEDW